MREGLVPYQAYLYITTTYLIKGTPGHMVYFLLPQ